MKVALVHDFLLKFGGAEKVLSALVEIFPSAPIYTLLYDEEKMGRYFSDKTIITSDLQKFPRFFKKNYRYFFTKMPVEMEKFDFSEFDLVISSSSAYAHGIITNSNTKHICYCHSPMRYAWDWYHEYKKEQKKGKLMTAGMSYLLHKLRIWDKTAADRADIYIANSKNVQKRIKKYYRLDSKIIYPPVDTENFSLRESHENYFLIVSTLSPYKNIELAIQLFNKLGRKLIIIGDGRAKNDLMKQAADNIEFLGFKDNSVVKEYMENCRAFIFPGEEDFGIAPVEAMACGKPVLAFAKGGLKESMIEGVTGEFFYKPDINSMEDALARLLLNEKSYSPARIRNQAQKFSKQRFADEIKEAVNQSLKI